MATSSIFANVVINDEETAKRLAQIFEDFEAHGTPYEKSRKHPVLSPEEVAEFFANELPEKKTRKK